MKMLNLCILIRDFMLVTTSTVGPTSNEDFSYKGIGVIT